ncbi:hypothetical protein VKT23_019764 [Stygiomarasmius scandens]|uniref:Uncharacterized protein n=1 Tax=Marasmiellus scandens TaxID=2682957 RepID=A0ABR1IKG3_9AGAR
MTSDIVGNSPTFAVANLIDSAKEAFRSLEPWCNAQAKDEQDSKSSKVDNYYGNKLIKRVKKNAFAYFEAIDRSVQCSEKGIIFCNDAISLRKFLERQENRQDILDFTRQMRKTAKKAHRDAKKIVAAFSCIHEEVEKTASETVPKIRSKIEQEPEAHRQWAKMAQAIKGFMPQDHGIGLAMSTGAVFGIIILPLAIPMAVLAVEAAAGFVEKRCSHKAEECKLTMEESLAQVDKISNTLEIVGSNVLEFLNWWSDTGDMLDIIEQNVASGNFFSPEMYAILDRWVRVKERYQEYAFEIKKLQTYYPVKR